MEPLTLNQVMALLLPRALSTSITLPLEMLAAAHAMGISHSQRSTLTHRLVSPDGQPVTLTGGIQIAADQSIDDAVSADLVIIPGLWRNPKPVLRQYPRLIQWLRQQHAQGAIIIASGSGVYLPAAAGLLHNLPATTHWFLMERFRDDFPTVRLKANHLITEANRIYCAGSVNSIADVLIHVIHRAWGKPIAQHVEQQFSYEVRRSYDSISFSAAARRHNDEEMIAIQQYIEAHFTQSLTVPHLAEQAKMSVRNLTRRFYRATDISLVQYIRALRLKTAKELLKDSNLTISATGEYVGYVNSIHFCRIFHQAMGMSPSAYRKRVRGKIFSLT